MWLIKELWQVNSQCKDISAHFVYLSSTGANFSFTSASALLLKIPSLDFTLSCLSLNDVMEIVARKEDPALTKLVMQHLVLMHLLIEN